MKYASELRSHWKPLLAATLGLAMGMSLQGYINSIFAPQLVEEFAWPRATFALTAMVSSVAVLCIPIVGRLTDRFGDVGRDCGVTWLGKKQLQRGGALFGAVRPRAPA